MGSSRGTGRDNPEDPAHLTDLQASRSVTFEYEKVSKMPMTFSVGKGKKKKGADLGGRAFFFGGSAWNFCDKTTPPPVATTTTSLPEKEEGGEDEEEPVGPDLGSGHGDPGPGHVMCYAKLEDYEGIHDLK